MRDRVFYSLLVLEFVLAVVLSVRNCGSNGSSQAGCAWKLVVVVREVFDCECAVIETVRNARKRH